MNKLYTYYDIYILFKLQGYNIDNDLLTKALISTAKKRDSINLLDEGELILKEVFADNSSYKHWSRYQVKYIYANDISWKEIETSVKELWSALGLNNLEDNQDNL